MPDERKIVNRVSVLHLLNSYHDIHAEITPGSTTVAQPTCNIIFTLWLKEGARNNKYTTQKKGS